MPCNFHLRGLAEHVKEGVRAAGGTPMEFNTIAISDGITMGTEGMKTSLVSREVIADSIELTARGYQFDAMIALSACDKTIPGCVMALARLDIPSVMLYGGSIAPGRYHGKDVTILDVFEAIGAHAAGQRSPTRSCASSRTSPAPAPAPAAASSPRTRWPAPSRRSGISPGGSAMVPAEDDDKDDGRRADRRAGDEGPRARTCARARSSPRESLENAIAMRLRLRRLHQRRAAPARGRPRGRRRARHRRLRADLAADAAARRPEAGRPLRRDRPLPAPAACR